VKFPLIYQLPMWLSFGVTVVGLVLSLLLVRLAYGGILFAFTIMLTIGILIFSFHHFIDLLLPAQIVVSEALESLSSLAFLTAAIYLAYRIKTTIYGP